MESPAKNIEKLDETGQRKNGERRQQDRKVARDRRKVQRRRLIDPTTCERDYTNDEIEFMQAMDEYKRRSGRMFPTCSEILEVLRGIGYVRLEVPTDPSLDEADETESPQPAVRSAKVIAGSLDDVEDLDDSFDDSLDQDFDSDLDDE